MYVRIIEAALKNDQFGPTLDKQNLKIPGKGKPVVYFKNYLWDFKVQPENH